MGFFAAIFELFMGLVKWGAFVFVLVFIWECLFVDDKDAEIRKDLKDMMSVKDEKDD